MDISHRANQSPGDIADEIARAVDTNLVTGFECVARVLADASFTARCFADGVASDADLIDALAVALLHLETMVICRRERAMLRRHIAEVTAMTTLTDTPHDGAPGPIPSDHLNDTTGGMPL